MNTTFEKALYHLSHPVTLLTILGLFLNDHILRVFWPSWVTGKLGDFMWLYFMPFAVAVVLALLIPTRLRKHTEIVGALSFGLVGLLFLLGNSLPVLHTALVGALARISPFPIQITRDPTDLIALSSCMLGWLVWNKDAQVETGSKAKGALLIVASALLTIANSAIEADYGIECMQIADSSIIAISTYEYYVSEDGGLTWAFIERAENQECYQFQDQILRWEGNLVDPDDENKLYRMNGRRQFEYSADKGETWQKVPITLASQAEIKLIQLNAHTPTYYHPGPFHVIKDRQTGNLVFAMGLEGVLVRKVSGEWVLAPVGQYRLEKLTFQMITVLLEGEIALALALVLVLFCTLGLLRTHSWFRIVLTVFLWVPWIFIAISSKPALNGGIWFFLHDLMIVVFGIVGWLCTLLTLLRLSEKYPKKVIFQLSVFSLVGAVVFSLPYLLWALNVIPEYKISMVLGLVLMLIVMILGIWQVRRNPVAALPEPSSSEEGSIS